MKEVSINKNMHLSEHFQLGEVTKTSVKTADGNIPSRVHIENLKNLCEHWLEELREIYNLIYEGVGVSGVEHPSCHLERSREISPRATLGRDDNPIIITSGYRSPEVNKAVGGSPTSNHLTGCAVDIRCAGIERSKQGHYWIHFAARPKDNRRKTAFIQT